MQDLQDDPLLEVEHPGILLLDTLPQAVGRIEPDDALFRVQLPWANGVQRGVPDLDSQRVVFDESPVLPTGADAAEAQITGAIGVTLCIGLPNGTLVLSSGLPFLTCATLTGTDRLEVLLFARLA